MRKENELAYQKSLIVDQQKEIALLKSQLEQSKEKSNNKHQLDLMQIRASRVLPEPELDEDHVIITVRHCHLGRKTRMFHHNSPMTQVYDWVGSLAAEPEHFELVDFNACVVAPDVICKSGSLNMKEVSAPVNMSKEGEVSFAGFGVNASTVELKNALHDLEALCKTTREQMVRSANHIEVRRECIYDDMLSIYSNSTIINEKVCLLFQGESGVGDGVTKDIYDKFFHCFYEKCEGYNEKVPSATIPSDELEIFGKIVTHAFIQYGQFPVQLSKASMIKSLYRDVNKEELLQSFYSHLPHREVMLIQQLMSNKIVDVQPIIDILSEYKIFVNPCKENIEKLCFTAANVALIRLPCFAFFGIVNGMGNFWKEVSKEMFLSIYSCIIPSNQAVLDCFQPNEVQQVDQKIFTWLCRFIRSCNQSELCSFVRYITGSSNLWPGEVIRVEFIDQPSAHLRPMSQTCFKILQLPRQYVTFTQLSTNISRYINNDEFWAIHDIIHEI